MRRTRWDAAVGGPGMVRTCRCCWSSTASSNATPTARSLASWNSPVKK